MLGLYLWFGRVRSKRFEIPKLTVTIGSDEKNDLVLRDGRVPPFFCRLIFLRDRWFMAPPDEAAPESERSPVEDGAELAAGDYTIVLALRHRREAVERALLDQLAAGDPGSWIVYADWLEGNGEAARAEFLRLQQELSEIDPSDADARFRTGPTIQRARDLAQQLDHDWRLLVGRPAVEACNRAPEGTGLACGMDWGRLAPTTLPYERHCAGCGELVYYATSMLGARRHVASGHRIVIDLALWRVPGDLGS